MKAMYSREAASSIIAGFDARPEKLVQILHGFMDHFGWIPQDAVRQLADELNLSRAEVHATIRYYRHFRTSPPGKHVVMVCMAESCQAMGGRELSAHAQLALGLDMNASSHEFTLEPVYCLGNCACSPAVMVDGRTHGRVNGARFDSIIADLEGAE